MKTPMQELKNRFLKNKDNYSFMQWIYQNIDRLLEEEKQMVVDAYNQGCNDVVNDKFDNTNVVTGFKYFKDTYNER